MGFNLSYLASRQPLGKLAEIYRLELGPEFAEAPDPKRPWIAELSNGWSIWMVGTPDGFTLHTINPHLACAPGESSYAVSISEFCMHSSLAKYTSSSKRWSVTHHGDESPEHLKITGKPPQIFAKLRDELLDRQRDQTPRRAAKRAVPAELQSIASNLGATVELFGSCTVDYVFDLPAQLGQQFFGYRHDQELETGSVLRCVEVLGSKPLPEQKNTAPEKVIQTQENSLWRRIIGL